MIGSIYLAGPGVFRPDARAYGEQLKSLARDHDLLGLFPLDNEIPHHGTKHQIAAAIFKANVAQIDRCHAVVADISPFRGPNMDPGTAWELGYAHAAKKPIFAWSSDDRLLHARTLALCEIDHEGRDRQGFTIEDFDLAENLMIGCSAASMHASAKSAIAAAAAHLAKSKTA